MHVFAEDLRTKEILAADDARIAAMVSADSRLLAPLLSEDLQYSHSTGSIDTKKNITETNQWKSNTICDVSTFTTNSRICRF